MAQSARYELLRIGNSQLTATGGSVTSTVTTCHCQYTFLLRVPMPSSYDDSCYTGLFQLPEGVRQPERFCLVVFCRKSSLSSLPSYSYTFFVTLLLTVN
jgi:hypothetical protein